MESRPSADALNSLSGDVIAAAIAVHRALGPGLLESVYENCRCVELRSKCIRFEQQVAVPIVYKGSAIDGEGLRLDLLIENRFVVELKAIDKILPIHESQLLTYLRLADVRLGLLLNFNVLLLKDGVRRVVNNL